MSWRAPPAQSEPAAARPVVPVAMPLDRIAVPIHEDWVDVVRLVAVFLIVSAHVLNLDRRFLYMPVGSAGWIAVDAISAGIRWALPVFVMISGYFLLDGRKNLNWNAYYCRRMQRLAWPLLAWTALYLGISSCDNLAAGQPVDAATIGQLLIKGAPYYHLWYIYMLLGLYVVCPFIRLATDWMSPGQLTGAVALCFAVTALSAGLDAAYLVQNVTYIDDFPRYLGYLLAGHLLGRVLPSSKVAPVLAVLVASFLATAAAAWVVAEMFSPLHAFQLFGFWNPTVVALSLAAFALMRRVHVSPSWRVWIGRAGETSFGIYLVHPAILDLLRYWTYPHSLSAFVAEVMFVFVASLFVVVTMRRLPVLGRCV